jgi:hypothetical protein
MGDHGDELGLGRLLLLLLLGGDSLIPLHPPRRPRRPSPGAGSFPGWHAHPR